MTWRGAMVAALLGALERPTWWVLALASFLVRGGLAVFLLPIVILPTPAGIATAFGTELTGFAFGAPSGAFIATMVIATVAITAWLLVGGIAAAWIDVALVAAAGEIDGRDLRTRDWMGLAWRMLAIRLVSHIPLAIALAWAATRIYDATFAELKTPGDLATPLFLRIALRIPEVIAVLALAWVAGEAAGGLAVRHVALTGRSTVTALARGWFDLAARPSVVLTVLVTGAAIVASVVAMAFAAGGAWAQLRRILGGGSPELIVAALAVFAATWLAGMVAIGIVTAWRSSAWTLEVARREPVMLTAGAPVVAAGGRAPTPAAAPATHGAAQPERPAAAPGPAPEAAPLGLEAFASPLASPLEPMTARHAEGGEPV